MAFALVQHGTFNSSSATTNQTITAAGVGNLIVLGVFVLSGVTLNSVTDSAGNTYTWDATTTFTAQGETCYLVYGVQTTGGATTLTLHFSGANTGRNTYAEYSGGASSNAAIYDIGSNGNAASGTALSVTSFSPSASGELIVAVGFDGSGSGSFSAGTSYALAANNTISAQEYRLSGTTTETAPLTYNISHAWVEIAAAFKPAGAGATLKGSTLGLLGVG